MVFMSTPGMGSVCRFGYKVSFLGGLTVSSFIITYGGGGSGAEGDMLLSGTFCFLDFMNFFLYVFK